MSLYARPDTLANALALLAAGPRRILAGGTDLYPAAAEFLPGPVLDLSELPELQGITAESGLRIGAATTWSEIAVAGLAPALSALQQAARQVGGRQIQNMGTLGGNLCNASPAADGVPPLLVLDAVVELAGPGGRRRLALDKFLTVPRRTALAEGEVLVAVHLPPAALEGKSAFVKLGARSHLVISIAMAAARVVLREGKVAECALALGACSPVAMRLPGLEALVSGAPAAEAAARITAERVAAVISPISDIRATAAYRVEAAVELLRRAVQRAVT